MVPDFNDVLWPDGQDNPGGTGVQVLYAANGDIATWPALPAAPTTDAQYTTISANFTMVATKFFKKLYVTTETGEVKSTQQGENDGKSYKHEYECFHPGTLDAIEAFLRKFNNTGGAFVVTESNGTKRLIGNELHPARIETVEKTTGKKYADTNGQMIRIYSYGPGPCPKFTGQAPLS